MRELYAVSEIIRRDIFLLFENDCKGMNAVYIETIIRKKSETSKPLILLLTFDFKEDPCFVQIHEDTDLEQFEVINENHTRCLDKRFRNDFKNLRKNFLLGEEDKRGFDGTNTTGTNIFVLCSQLIYGGKEYAQAVKDCMKMHMEADDFREVYMQFVDVQTYAPKEEYRKMTAMRDEKKKEKILSKLTKKAFESHLTTWKSVSMGDYFAMASVYNVEIYVLPIQSKDRKDVTLPVEDISKGTKLFYPTCGRFVEIFHSPFIFQQIAEDRLKNYFPQRSCQCLTKTPRIFGHFPLMDDEIDLHRVEKLGLKSCCQARRHGRHHHFQLYLQKAGLDENMIERVNSPYISPMNTHIERILEILAEERKTLDSINGGEGSLANCISKEILGDENTELPFSIVESDVRGSLRIIADKTSFPLYVFVYEGNDYQWEYYQPSKGIKKRRTLECRYYITILHNKQSGHFDRIVSKNGCNCLQVPPYVVPLQGDNMHECSSKISSDSRHWPLLTFFPETPKDEMFSDDIREGIKVVPMYSEIFFIVEREDMKDRQIDQMSDYTHSLYRCVSKEIFGNEKQYQTIMRETVAEIRDHPQVYGHFLTRERENSDQNFLENFRYRKHGTFDFLKWNSTIAKESANFFADRIEDGMNLGDLELLAVATRFQVPIYVLCSGISEESMETRWTLFSQVVRKPRPKDFTSRLHIFDGGNKMHECTFDANDESNYYIALYRTFSGNFHRIVPRYKVCNCLLHPPRISSKKHKCSQNADYRLFYEMFKVKSKLTIMKLELDNWMRCNFALEMLCSILINELEGRRQNVNITNIVGSSVGLVGSALVIFGLIKAPFTAGVSLGLTVAGGVVGTLGSATATGSKITESVFNRKSILMLERYQMNLGERSRCLEKSISDFQKAMENIATQNADDTGATLVQTTTGALRLLNGLPIFIVGVIARKVTAVDVVLLPVSIPLDLGLLAFSIHNLTRGSKTNITERLRTFQSFLRATRKQMFIWGYGNQKNYLQTMNRMMSE